MRTKLYLGEELNAVFNSNINNRLFFNKVSIDSREVKNRAIFLQSKEIMMTVIDMLKK